MYIDPIPDNPEDGYTFTPEYPYAYSNGYVYAGPDGRRYAKLYDKRTSKRLNTALARYRYAVHLWQTKQEYIPDGHEVDHIDNDRTNDRMDNYQLLSSIENIKKKHAFAGTARVVIICPVCRTTCVKRKAETRLGRSVIDRLTFCSMSCRDKYRLAHFTLGEPSEMTTWFSNHQILYTIQQYTDSDYLDPYSDITWYGSREMLSDHPKYTVDIATEDTRYASTDEKVALIREYKLAGKTSLEIAKNIGISPGNVSKHIVKYIPEASRTTKIQRNVEAIKQLLPTGMTYEEIGDKIGLSGSAISSLVLRHTDHQKNLRGDELQAVLSKIEDYLSEGLSYTAISSNMDMHPSNVARLSQKHLGVEKGTRATGDVLVKLIDDIRMYIDQGKSKTEIGELLGRRRSTISELIDKYIGDVTVARKKRDTTELDAKIVELAKVDISNKSIARQLHTDPQYVKRVIMQHNVERPIVITNKEHIARLKSERAAKKAAYIETIKQHLSSGLTIREIATKLNRDWSSIQEIIKRHIPNVSSCYQ